MFTIISPFSSRMILPSASFWARVMAIILWSISWAATFVPVADKDTGLFISITWLPSISVVAPPWEPMLSSRFWDPAPVFSAAQSYISCVELSPSNTKTLIPIFSPIFVAFSVVLSNICSVTAITSELAIFASISFIWLSYIEWNAGSMSFFMLTSSCFCITKSSCSLVTLSGDRLTALLINIA